MIRPADLLRRLTHHGHDGDIERLIEMAYTHALRGHRHGCQRAVHTIQNRHPAGIYALLNTAADRVLAARGGGVWLLRALDGPDGVSAWIVLCRTLGDPHALYRDMDPRPVEQQRDIAVDLLLWATRQVQEATR